MVITVFDQNNRGQGILSLPKRCAGWERIADAVFKGVKIASNADVAISPVTSFAVITRQVSDLVGYFGVIRSFMGRALPRLRQ